VKILFIHIGKTKPSARLRILPLASRMQELGHQVSLTEAPHTLGGRMHMLAEATRHDVVVLQKKLFPLPYLFLLQKANRNLIFDVDDAVMFHELERSQPIAGNFFRRFAKTAALSCCVVTGNAYLADFARAARTERDRCNVYELPTPIDTDRLHAKTQYAQQQGFTIGWLGTKGNLKQLVKLAEPLRAVQKEAPDSRLLIVADASIDLPGVHVEYTPWRAQDEQKLLQSFDVGIMPLEDTLWNRGKGGYKLLQYMAAGLPAIASPVGINEEIVADGKNGFLASHPETWRARLLELACSLELRQCIGQAARATVLERYSLSAYLEKYCRIIEDCLQ